MDTYKADIIVKKLRIISPDSVEDQIQLIPSELNAEGINAQRIRNICLALKTTQYISGVGGKTYLDEKDFQKHDVEIVYIPPFEVQYQQLYPQKGFVSGLSIVDYLFNCGIDEVRQTLIQLAQQHLPHGKLSVHA